MRFPFRQTVAVYRHVRRKKKEGGEKFPLVLMLEPLHACNLSCSGCGRIREYKAHLSEMLPLEMCLAAIDASDAPVVSICGGEPLLYPQIRELVLGALDRGRVVYLCTNGQALSKKLHLFRPHKMFNINVHVDGLAKTHDAIVKKPGAFDEAIAGIKAAKNTGFTVCTNTTVYKQTDTEEIKALISFLKDTGIDGILISPSFDYTDAPDQSVFMTRGMISEKFSALRGALNSKKIWSTPLFLDFLAGERDFPCTPWGNVTYNILGWKAPCYLVTDGHYGSFHDLMSKVCWDKYGPNLDPRCANCMMHSGFEATVALVAWENIKDALRMAWWTLL